MSSLDNVYVEDYSALSSLDNIHVFVGILLNQNCSSLEMEWSKGVCHHPYLLTFTWHGQFWNTASQAVHRLYREWYGGKSHVLCKQQHRHKYRDEIGQKDDSRRGSPQAGRPFYCYTYAFVKIRRAKSCILWTVSAFRVHLSSICQADLECLDLSYNGNVVVFPYEIYTLLRRHVNAVSQTLTVLRRIHRTWSQIPHHPPFVVVPFFDKPLMSHAIKCIFQPNEVV